MRDDLGMTEKEINIVDETVFLLGIMSWICLFQIPYGLFEIVRHSVMDGWTEHVLDHILVTLLFMYIAWGSRNAMYLYLVGIIRRPRR